MTLCQSVPVATKRGHEYFISPSICVSELVRVGASALELGEGEEVLESG